MQHEDFRSGDPTLYYSPSNTLNRRVLMGSSALVLVLLYPIWNALKLHLTHVERYDVVGDGCTHVLVMAGMFRADTSRRKNAMDVRVRVEVVAVKK